MTRPTCQHDGKCGPMYAMYRGATYLFDPLHHWWESDATQRKVAGMLVLFFLGAMATIEMNRQGLLPSQLAAMTPTSHYMAINLAFTLVLVLEVVSLIFTLPCSISKAVGKQFEILALIMVRSSFKELVNFPEPIRITGQEQALFHIVSDGTAALIIFALLGLYMRIRRDADEENTKGLILFKFVAAKKIVALLLLVAFFGMGALSIWQTLNGHHDFDFFQAFYTILIFSDILLVLIAQRYLPAFNAVFRNSGFALATLLIRLALTAPPYYNAALGIGAALFAVLLAWTYNCFFTPSSRKNS